MALSETQIIKIGKILERPTINISDQVSWLGDRLTAALETAIEAELTAWDAGPGTVTEWAKLHPKEANKGVETNPDRDADTIRTAIANYLERPDWAMSASGVEFDIVRG